MKRSWWAGAAPDERAAPHDSTAAEMRDAASDDGGAPESAPDVMPGTPEEAPTSVHYAWINLTISASLDDPSAECAFRATLDELFDGAMREQIHELDLVADGDGIGARAWALIEAALARMRLRAPHYPLRVFTKDGEIAPLPMAARGDPTGTPPDLAPEDALEDMPPSPFAGNPPTSAPDDAPPPFAWSPPAPEPLAGPGEPMAAGLLAAHDAPATVAAGPGAPVVNEAGDTDAPVEPEEPDDTGDAGGSDEPVAPDCVAPLAATPPDDEVAAWVPGKSPYVAEQHDGRWYLGPDRRDSIAEAPNAAAQTSSTQHRPDVAADIVEAGRLRVMAASFRGSMHYYAREVRQDSFALGAIEGDDGRSWLVAAIADGVSSTKRSHVLADYLARVSVALLRETIGAAAPADLADLDWRAIAWRLVELSRAYCKRLAGKDTTLDQWRRQWAATLEFAVVQTNAPAAAPFAAVTVAGDGAAYLLDPRRGWRTVKSGKERTGDLASNAVAALPDDPGQPVVRFGEIQPTELLLLGTDGISDFLGNGGTSLGGFLQERLPGCANLLSFMQLIDVSMYQADDDRTAIALQVR